MKNKKKTSRHKHGHCNKKDSSLTKKMTPLLTSLTKKKTSLLTRKRTPPSSLSLLLHSCLL